MATVNPKNVQCMASEITLGEDSPSKTGSDALTLTTAPEADDQTEDGSEKPVSIAKVREEERRRNLPIRFAIFRISREGAIRPSPPALLRPGRFTLTSPAWTIPRERRVRGRTSLQPSRRRRRGCTSASSRGKDTSLLIEDPKR
jgi:hypothetical protein